MNSKIFNQLSYMKVTIIDNFIEDITIYINYQDFIKDLYISQLDLSDNTSIIYEDNKLKLINRDNTIIKYDDGTYNKNVFFTDKVILNNEKFLIEEEVEEDNFDEYYSFRFESIIEFGYIFSLSKTI